MDVIQIIINTKLGALMGDKERGAVTFYDNGIELPRGDNLHEI